MNEQKEEEICLNINHSFKINASVRSTAIDCWRKKNHSSSLGKFNNGVNSSFAFIPCFYDKEGKNVCE